MIIMMKTQNQNNYNLNGILPFIISILGKDIPNEADPFITFCFNISILAIIVLICFTNSIGYFISICIIKKYSLESKYPKLKKLIKYYEKTSTFFILVELIIGYVILIVIIIFIFYRIIYNIILC